MHFKVYRDWDQRLRLRKWVIELYDANDRLLHRARMVGGLLFKKRLEWKLNFLKLRARQVTEVINKVNLL